MTVEINPVFNIHSAQTCARECRWAGRASKIRHWDFMRFSQLNFQIETDKKKHFSINENASKQRSSNFILKIQYSLHTEVQKAERKAIMYPGLKERSARRPSKTKEVRFRQRTQTKVQQGRLQLNILILNKLLLKRVNPRPGEKAQSL